MALISNPTVTVRLVFKIAVFFTALFAAQVLPAAEEWGPTTNNLQMSIHLKDGGNAMTKGQPCTLEIRYRNVSTNETFIALRMNWVESDGTYSFTVIDPSVPR